MERKTPNPKSQMLENAVVGSAGISWEGVTPPPGMGAVLLYVPISEVLGKSPLDIQSDLGMPWHCEGHPPVWFDEHLQSTD